MKLFTNVSIKSANGKMLFTAMNFGGMAKKLIDQLDCPYSYPYFWTGPSRDKSYPVILQDSTIQISAFCDPHFVDSGYWNCTENYENGVCDLDVNSILYYAVEYEHGYETVLNCPECGCNGRAALLPPYDPNEARSGNHHGHK